MCVCVPLCDLIESMRKMDEHGLRIHFGGKKLGAPLPGLFWHIRMLAFLPWSLVEVAASC